MTDFERALNVETKLEDANAASGSIVRLVGEETIRKIAANLRKTAQVALDNNDVKAFLVAYLACYGACQALYQEMGK